MCNWPRQLRLFFRLARAVQPSVYVSVFQSGLHRQCRYGWSFAIIILDNQVIGFFFGFGANRWQELPLYVPDITRPAFSVAV